MNGYGHLAKVYDILNADIDYSDWADGIEAAFSRWLPRKPELVLDLACGTGRMTFELARRGYDMTGADISADMLTVARSRQTRENILWILQDMRRFELYGSVGAVVCCLDAVNCLLRPSDLRSCFAGVHNYLDPGGLFLFDVNTPYKFSNVFSDNAYILESDGIFCGWQNKYNKDSGVCDFYLSLFERGKNGTYNRYDETQKEKMYGKTALQNALCSSGLEPLGFFGGYDMSEPQNDCERWYIAARKPL